MKALIVALCLSAAPASATTYTIGPATDPGGVVFDYFAKYDGWYHEQADVRIEGECDSACTMVLGFIPNDRICATANAEFGFHSASRGGKYAKVMTALLWELYPERVLRLLAPLGLGKPIEHPAFVFVEAQKIVHPCGPRQEAAAAKPQE